MTSRGRGVSITDWDPMRDEFNDTSYIAQYPDEDASDGVQLDHKKLYITKLPAALSQEGFVDLFSKYGRVVHSFFSREPTKKYAFVTFETAGEARIAMMKLNKTEPFNMNIFFAHNKNPPRTQHSQPNMDRSYSNADRLTNRHSNIDRQSYNSTTDAGSVSSKGRISRMVEDQADENTDDDNNGSEVGNDPKLGYDLEKIKLQRLQIMDQQLQVQQRMLIHQQRMKTNTIPVIKRRLLPDGRSIQVTSDNETNFTAGGGDSNTLNVQRNIPGLQREPARQCVVCGVAADLYCAGCGVTPYCTERCQRRDWETRHRAVCHNLARSAVEKDKMANCVSPDVPTVSSLRRPHSPVQKTCESSNNSGPEKESKQSSPAMKTQSQLKDNQPKMQNNNRNQPNRNVPANCRVGKQYKDGSNRNQLRNVRDNNDDKNNNMENDKGYQPLRRPLRQAAKETQSKPSQKGETQSKPMQPKEESKQVLSIDVTPCKPLVPSSFLIDKLKVGETFLAEVVALAADCGSKQQGYVCLTLHQDYSQMYDSLCDEFAALCEKDSEHYTPCIGETFAHYCADEGAWYRARCLARTRGALLDAGRVVSLAPDSSRRLPSAFAEIPEFMAVFHADKLTIGGHLTCKVLSGAPNVKVEIADEAGNVVKLDASRLKLDIEYPKPRPIPQEQTKKLTLRRPLMPSNYLLEKLENGASFLCEAIALAADCGSKQQGYVCLTLHQDYSQMYDSLCDEFAALCEKDSEHYTPCIGETFAHYCADEGAWYRARCLARTRGALLDAGRVVSLAPDSSRRLPSAFAEIPEFMAVFHADKLTIGEHMSCKILSSSDGIKVSLEYASGTKVVAEANRWQPDMECPTEPVTSKPSIQNPQPKSSPTIPEVMPKSSPTIPEVTPKPSPTIPEVPRPRLEHNSVCVLLDVTSLRRACVRPTDPRAVAMFDAVLQDTLLYGLSAPPLEEPPKKGDTVVAKFLDDGIHYRAFVKRVNVAMNKYLIEYIEYGNEEIVTLDRLHPCPANLQLDARPTQASLIKLSDREPAKLTPAAIKYIDKLKENAVELILTIPSGAKSAPSGSIATLVVAKDCEPASKQIEELCTPEWKRLAERGGDVLELETCFFNELQYVPLPTSHPFTMRVTFYDKRTLSAGTICGHEKGVKEAEFIITDLSKQIEEYCESSLCKEPYLPRLEEMCAARHPKTSKWVRSVLVQLTAGADSALVLAVDSGELMDTPVRDLRKLPRELALPKASAQNVDLHGFPTDVSQKQLERAMRLLERGEIRVTSCRLLEENMYEITAPDVLSALTS